MIKELHLQIGNLVVLNKCLRNPKCILNILWHKRITNLVYLIRENYKALKMHTQE